MATEFNPMSPDASPGQVTKKLGTRRVNNTPIYIVGGVMLGFLLIMVVVASDRAKGQKEVTPTQLEKGGNANSLAKEIAGDMPEGFIDPVAKKVEPAPTPIPVIEKTASLGNPQPLPVLPPPQNEDEERIRRLKFQQLEEAAKAKSALPMAPLRGMSATKPRAATPAGEDVSSYKDRVKVIQAALNSANGDDSGQIIRASANRNDLAQFGNQGQGDRWRLDSKPEAPLTAYVLRAGFVIPATLISGINSELPGQISAQVSHDVYDTATGKWKLIPQGSRLVGAYSSEVAYGQARVFVAWQRIVFPDGKAMDIGSMPGADGAGYSGFSDQVNNHYMRLFASAFLLSGVTAGVAVSQPQASSTSTATTQSFSSAMSQALGQQMGQVTAQLIAKNMNIAPTLEIRPGYRFNVVVNKDLTFSKAYQSFDY